MKAIATALLVGVIALMSGAQVRAQPVAGVLDPSFGSGGKVTMSDWLGGNSGELNAALLRPDGGIMGVGFIVSAGGSEFSLIGLNSDGSLDESFGSGGDVTGDFFPNGRAFAAALYPDGRIIVAGYIPGGDDEPGFALARYNADGSNDASFGPTGDGLVFLRLGWAHFAYDLAVQPDGKIILAGDILPVGSTTGRGDFALVRLNPDGSLDSGFGDGGKILVDFLGGSDDAALGVRVLPGGGILALGGVAPPYGSTAPTQVVLARYDSAGGLDSSFGSGGYVVLESVIEEGNRCAGFEVQPDGKIVLAVNRFEGDVLFRFEANGTPDLSFGDGGRVDDFAGQCSGGMCSHMVGIDTDGKILVLSGTDAPDLLLTRYRPDGTLDTGFGTGGRVSTDFEGGEDCRSAILLPGDGTYVAAGTIFLADGRTAFGFARYLRVAGIETQAGSGVTVQPVDGRTESLPVTLTFEQVTTPGLTHLKTSTSGPTPPLGFSLGDPATYYGVVSTAEHSGSIQVCINYSSVRYQDENALALWHYENEVWENVTTSLDTATDVICGVVASLSTFAIFEPAGGQAMILFLHGGPSTANPATLWLDPEAPAGMSVRYKDSAGVTFSNGNPWKLVGTWDTAAGAVQGNLTSLGGLCVWLGLKNSDDIGTRFDLRAEILKNGAPIAASESLCIGGITRNPALAREATLSFGAFAPVELDGVTDTLTLRVSARIGTTPTGDKCAGHNNAVGLRMYFDAATRNSRLNTRLTP